MSRRIRKMERRVLNETELIKIAYDEGALEIDSESHPDTMRFLKIIAESKRFKDVRSVGNVVLCGICVEENEEYPVNQFQKNVFSKLILSVIQECGCDYIAFNFVTSKFCVELNLENYGRI